MTVHETWHADSAMLEAYVAKRLSRAMAASIETHLVACATCRSAIAPLVEPPRLERNLAAVVGRINQPPRHALERWMERIGVPDHVVRAVAVSTAQRVPWLAAIVAVAAVADLVSATGTTMFVLLVMAPLVPLAGVTAGATLARDPVGELVAATPTTRFRMLMLRSVGVLVPAVVLSAAVAVLAPGSGWEPVLWLLPALAMSATALAVGTWISIRPVAWALGGFWLAAGAVAARGAPSTEVVDRFVGFRPAGQVALLAIGLFATGVAVARRDRLDFIELRRMA
jgi:hypothetical protein